MKWYDEAVFYHIYPLGLCGCKKENDGVREEHFENSPNGQSMQRKLGVQLYI